MASNVKEENEKLEKALKRHPSFRWLTLIFIPVSENCNAIYNKADVLFILFESALTKISIAGAAYAKLQAELVKNSKKRIPSGEYFRLLLKSAAEYDFEKMFTRIVRKHINILKGAGCLPKILDVAIDIHYITRYDKKENDGLIKSKIKKLLQRGEKYMTAQITNTGATVTVNVQRMRKGDKNIDFIGKIMKDFKRYGLRTRVFLLDREFFATDVFEMFQKIGKTFLIPCKKTPKVKKYLNEFKKGKRNQISKAKITDSDGKSIEYYMIMTEITKNGKKELAAFATNNKNIDIEKYKSRWVIETGYRCTDLMKLKTSSRDSQVRLLAFILSVLFYNGWILARFVQDDNDLFAHCKRIPQAVFRAILLVFFESYMDPWPPPNAIQNYSK